MSAETRFLNPETLFQPPGYTQVVEATAPARVVYIAGQLGIDRDGKLPSDFRSQAVQTFENLRLALEAVGGRFEHIVKLNNYLVDNSHLPLLRDIRSRYLKEDAPPASTTLQVAGFARLGALLEIEAVAILPALSKRRTSTGSKASKAASPTRSRGQPSISVSRTSSGEKK